MGTILAHKGVVGLTDKCKFRSSYEGHNRSAKHLYYRDKVGEVIFLVGSTSVSEKEKFLSHPEPFFRSGKGTGSVTANRHGYNYTAYEVFVLSLFCHFLFSVSF